MGFPLMLICHIHIESTSMVSNCLHIDCLFYIFSRLTRTKAWKLRIFYPLKGKSTHDRGIPPQRPMLWKAFPCHDVIMNSRLYESVRSHDARRFKCYFKLGLSATSRQIRNAAAVLISSSVTLWECVPANNGKNIGLPTSQSHSNIAPLLM